MGLSDAFLADLLVLREGRWIADGARVAEIGAQQLADDLLTSAGIADLAASFNRGHLGLQAPVGEASFTNRAPDSAHFWSALGLKRIAIEFKSSAADQVAMDLNTSAVPEDLRGQFDLVVNAGTTEHVANQANAFKIIHDLTAVRGVMYHDVPGEMLEHGLISYNLKFFQLLAAHNGYHTVFLRRGSENGSTMVRAAFCKATDSPFQVPLDVPPRFMALKNRRPFRQIRDHAQGIRLRYDL